MSPTSAPNLSRQVKKRGASHWGRASGPFGAAATATRGGTPTVQLAAPEFSVQRSFCGYLNL